MSFLLQTDINVSHTASLSDLYPIDFNTSGHLDDEQINARKQYAFLIWQILILVREEWGKIPK